MKAVLRIWIVAALAAMLAACSGSANVSTGGDKASSAAGAETTTSPLPPAAGTESGSTGGSGQSDQQDAVGASLSNPFEAGAKTTAGNWRIQVIGFTSDADDAIAHENMFNDKPKSGFQYAMVTLKATYIGNGSSDPFFDITPTIIESHVSYEAANAVLPEDMSDAGNIPTGAAAIGNFAFEVRKAGINSAVLYLEVQGKGFNKYTGFYALS